MKIYIDGGVKRHQLRELREGYISIILGDENILEEAGNVTNNQAEYLALIRALQEAYTKKISRVEVLSDSELLVKQIKEEYKIKSKNLIPLHKKAKELISRFDSFEIRWVPRELNQAGRLLEQRI